MGRGAATLAATGASRLNQYIAPIPKSAPKLKIPNPVAVLICIIPYSLLLHLTFSSKSPAITTGAVDRKVDLGPSAQLRIRHFLPEFGNGASFLPVDLTTVRGSGAMGD